MSQRDMAARALKAVEAIRRDTGRNTKLKTLCMKTPALLQQSGLAQSVVFLRSREVASAIGETYLNHLVATMGSEAISTTQQLQRRALEETDLSSYIALTSEAQNAAAWLRRFAQIELADVLEEERQGDE
ncbi:MAG: type III-B CRISPR module-associated protein Cmr5 [Deltaproteobacteria bacterium]|nr:MAG: type III-B CRISPR module-associated protein Cmr5 [Deltaproteobacteria bacterium]